jgi:transcriptional regulator with XRE-family HTH domain
MGRGETIKRPERLVLGRNVRRLRNKKKWSQERLGAEASGLRQAAVSEIETGDANPTLDTLEHLAAALGVRVVDLFRRR